MEPLSEVPRHLLNLGVCLLGPIKWPRQIGQETTPDTALATDTERISAISVCLFLGLVPFGGCNGQLAGKSHHLKGVPLNLVPFFSAAAMIPPRLLSFFWGGWLPKQIDTPIGNVTSQPQILRWHGRYFLCPGARVDEVQGQGLVRPPLSRPREREGARQPA